MFREDSRLSIILPSKHISTNQPIIIWSVAALFTIFQLLVEMLTNTMTSSLMASFKINHATVGLLSSIFFYTFLAMQFPVGIMLDKFNIRWLLTIACTGCGIGCFMFAHSISFFEACFSRFVMGLFAAFGFLGLLKISTMWYPKRIFPFLVGFSQLLVMSMTAFSEPIAVYCVKYYGWRYVLQQVSYLAFLIALLIGIFVRHRPELSNNQDKKIGLSKSLSTIFSSKKCWLAGLFGFGMFSMIAVFSGLWGLPYLMTVNKLTTEQAAFGISMSFFGVGIGCVCFGFVSSYFNNTINVMYIGAYISLILIISLVFSPKLTAHQTYIFLFFLSFFTGSFFLCFDIIKKSFSETLSSVATAFCNILVMSSAILLQPMVGFLIDTNKIFNNKIPIELGFKLSIIPLIISIFISCASIHFLKKTSKTSIKNNLGEI